MADKTVKVDLDAMNPTAPPEVAVQAVEEKDVVFVAWRDVELTINQETFKFVARAPKKVTRDQARVLKEAGVGYVQE